MRQRKQCHTKLYNILTMICISSFTFRSSADYKQHPVAGKYRQVFRLNARRLRRHTHAFPRLLSVTDITSCVYYSKIRQRPCSGFSPDSLLGLTEPILRFSTCILINYSYGQHYIISISDCQVLSATFSRYTFSALGY